jgi:diadenosine tetraphosphatase ApaH/serine/threonine PP2A family protein phosphatase
MHSWGLRTGPSLRTCRLPPLAPTPCWCTRARTNHVTGNTSTGPPWRGAAWTQLYYRGTDGKPIVFAPVPGVPVPLAAHRSWLALVGSVGQPRDGDPRAMYALFDAAQARLTFQRVAYDHGGTAAAIRAAGLPEAFAQRLERGR